MRMFSVIAVLAVVTPSYAIADPIFGLWKTVTENNEYAYIKMAPCGPDICGTIANTFADGKEVKSDLLGKKIVWELKPADGNMYSGGRIWRRSNGKTYNLKMTLSGNSLAIQGCFLGVCQSGGTWKRVN